MFGFARARGVDARQTASNGPLRLGEEQPDSGVRATNSSTCDECGSEQWVRVVREHRSPFRRPVTLVAVQCADCGRTPF
jgi:hypothetical protein